MFLGNQHQQEVADSEIFVSTKDRQQQSPGSKVDSEIYDSMKDQQQQSPGSKVDSEIYDSTKDHEQQSPSSMGDLEISALMKDSNKLLMSDIFFDNRMETIINAGFKNISTGLW